MEIYILQLLAGLAIGCVLGRKELNIIIKKSKAKNGK